MESGTAFNPGRYYARRIQSYQHRGVAGVDGRSRFDSREPRTGLLFGCGNHSIVYSLTRGRGWRPRNFAHESGGSPPAPKMEEGSCGSRWCSSRR